MSKENRSLPERELDRVLISEVEIDSAIRRIADEIDEYAADRRKNLMFLGILKGSVVFMGDLIKRIRTPIDIDFMKVSSNDEGELNVLLDLTETDISGKDIVIVNDIIGSCRTLSRLVTHLCDRGAKSVKTCTLLDKPSKRKTQFSPDFVGFEIPDEFVVGYGLDFNGQYRALSYIGVLKSE